MRERPMNDGKKPVALDELIRDFEEDLIRSRESDLYKVILEAVERPLIEKALERTFGNKIKAARILGVNRNTLHAKILKLKIDVEKFKYY
jgi:two-component system, NtrC family, nitrogen regulation response regulator GlnG